VKILDMLDQLDRIQDRLKLLGARAHLPDCITLRGGDRACNCHLGDLLGEIRTSDIESDRNTRMSVYYAHCQAIYDTPQERRDVQHLENLGFDVVNPNTSAINERCAIIRRDFVPPHEQRGSGFFYTDAGAAVMYEIFKPLVESCDAVAFRALPDGSIPAGVHSEIEWATASRAGQFGGVFELPRFFGRRILTVEETRDYLREVGKR
jgi:hypothetical protein